MVVGFNYPAKVFSEYCSQSEALHGSSQVVPLESSGEIVALQEAITFGAQQKELGIEPLNRWNELVLCDYVALGDALSPTLERSLEASKGTALTSLLRELNDELKNPNLRSSPVDKVKLLASLFVKFETLQPYHVANDALARILVNYANSRFYSPIYIFRSTETQEINEAKSDDAKCQRYFAKKIKEAAFDNVFSYLKCIRSSDATCFYRGADGESLTLQWHELDTLLSGKTN